MPKITITNINNVGWANRLIISYQLHQDCFNPSLASWEYISDSCGYRNICDEDWITITPNTQHPLHSNVIKYAGQYTYVWDYGGIFGLNPSNFDAAHSYLIQLCLADHSCNLIDPCATASYTTPLGDEPLGVVGSLGDSNNNFNNCGPGYYLAADQNGCLYCEIVSNTGEPAPPAVDDLPAVFEPEPTPQPPEPSDPGLNIPFDGVYNNTTAYDHPTNGADAPDVTVTTPGPFAPSSTLDNLYVNEARIVGYRKNPMPQNYSYELGPNTSTSDQGTWGPGEQINSPLKGMTFGGRSPSIQDTEALNTLVSTDARCLVSPDNASLNKRVSADQLNLNPHLTSSASKFSSMPAADQTTTKIGNAINVNNNNVYLASNNKSTSRPTSEYNAEINQRAVDSLVNAPLKNVNDVVTINNLELGPGARDLGFIKNNIITNLSLLTSLPEFVSQFNLGLVNDITIRSGDGLFVDLVLAPIGSTVYNLAVGLFVKTDTDLIELTSTSFVPRKGKIHIANKFQFRSKSGSATLIAVVYDTNFVIQGIKYVPIVILDPSTKSGGIVNVSSSVSSSSSIEQLISPVSWLTSPIGLPNNYIDYIINIVPGNSEYVVIGILVTTTTPNTEHTVVITDKIAGKVYNNTGKLKIDGLNPAGNYSTAVYIAVLRSAISSELRLRISNIQNQSTVVTVGLNEFLSFKNFSVPSNVFDYSSYTFSVTSSPLSVTSLQYFLSQNKDIVPESVVTYDTITDSDGVTTALTLSTTDRSWIGIAYKYPTDLSLSKRLYKFIRIGEANV